jgi:tetratricopeptide (TPR) repeat protein
MNCSNCGKELKDHWKQCPWCKASTTQTLKCQNCGEEMEEGMVLCPECGVELQTADKTDYDKYLDQGWDLFDNDQYFEAIKSFSEALKFEPYCSACYSLRGICHDKLKNFKEAINDLTKAIELVPSNAYYYKSRSNALFNLANEQQDDYNILQRALVDAKKAYELEPNEEHRNSMGTLIDIIELIEANNNSSTTSGNSSTGDGILRGIGTILGSAAAGFLGTLADDDDD